MLGNTNTCQFRWAKTWSATRNGTTNYRDNRQYSCLYHDWCILNFTTWFAIYRPTVAKTAGLPICPWFLTGEMAPFLRQSKESGADLVGIVSEEIVLWSSGILCPMYNFFFLEIEIKRVRWNDMNFHNEQCLTIFAAKYRVNFIFIFNRS